MKRLHLRNSGLLGACLLLASCMTTPNPPTIPYKEPTTGPVARVTLRTETDVVNMAVTRYRGGLSGCYCSGDPGEIILIFNNKIIGFGSSQYMDKGHGDVKRVDFKVPADGSELRLHSNATNLEKIERPVIEMSACQPNVAFIPVAGASYDVSYNFHRAPCQFKVTRTDGTPINVETKKYPLCLDLSPEVDWFRRRIKQQCDANPVVYKPAPL